MILVVGYGNPLRGDDGLGWAVTTRLERAPGVEVTWSQMLVPELAERIASAAAVIFVDARVGRDAGAVHCEAIAPPRPSVGRAGHHSLGHVASPEGLVGLAEALTGRSPRVFLVSVTGADFGFSSNLSAAVRRAVPEVVQTIGQLIDSLRAEGGPAARPRPSRQSSQA